MNRTATRTPAWLAVAAAELRLLTRNRTALLMATLAPVGFAAYFLIVGGDNLTGGTADLAALQLVTLLAFTVYVTTTMTLAGRRSQLYLKRLRSSRAATADIVTGLATPLVALLALQAVILLGATAVADGAPPARPLLILLAVVVGALTCVALAFLTAAFTSSGEAAQLTTMPVFVALLGGTIWINLTAPEDVAVWQLAVPGGAVAQLTRLGWGGPHLAAPEATEVLLAVTVAATVATAACLLAARLFRWEPRT